ncbi:MAG: UDP-N-acetylmuramoyl-L-alanine--D-glutamate ligase [Candidatus Doudnabacteria bacterium CG10_big_fil_rev_8_21_14_0_10_42_18]|uniref:UDP-N-acetylmuramoylalanine--D-glutamate ligase n=1 Tax=Candidatus Doudnabacteria bacterium CG10_big_fil_rev_8_21_14_0_10_42_18 TaxID=1974552 RepID=A0A2H0VAZ7_9BACT|nr:MAG: UDP-N-acetylmuramoyl-L-alanine--D-glutamate ligase [Candidatus Doudnabacteria bacterium CG10_big_fil_rev_8_21_14_0_10_42_18]
MKTQDLKDKLVAVLGYGLEGKATAAYLLKHGIKPVLFDQRPWKKWEKHEQEKIKKLKVNFIFGPEAFKELAGFEIAFRSPGIPLSHPDLQVFKDTITFTSQTKWFFEHSRAKIIGVTGTKGKGTTASLIYEMLKSKSNKLTAKNYLTGNIGKEQPFEFLDFLKPDDWVVYELSSFQLQDLGKSPHIGVVLMITQEHLDYHSDVNEYVDAKAAICKFQTSDDFVIYNGNYETSADIGEAGKGHKLIFSTLASIGSYCSEDCYIHKHQILLKGKPFLNINKIRLKGEHNRQNVCAAILAANAAGCGQEAIRKAIKNFKGLPHRLEFVAERQEIKFYDDSISTTPETTIAAIKSFDENLILILGGSSKKSDFSELGKIIRERQNIKAVILVGQETRRIKKAIGKTKFKLLEGAKNMKEIFIRIKRVASGGDVVLLSPACASFGMFKNYQDRGDQFKKFANKF